jgi:hypothetical protein
LEENNGIISNITIADNLGVKNYEDQNGYPVIEIVDLSKSRNELKNRKRRKIRQNHSNSIWCCYY